ncbi:hypothetical protein [Methylocystis sp. ATCC 49242]|uniref:hypothetical protein n=1 Tax=Methylocystis sp. ATCC 49242 TaxID=622637 RepID=UPI0001F87E26|nr:hypothetical protein [Methylocystis sp. ATCC 49242]
MTDATSHGHSHGHSHDHGHAHARLPAPVVATIGAERTSLLGLSAVGRLGGVALLLAALWAGVFWALH